MRITQVIFVGSLAALVAATAPALAKNSQNQKTTEEKTTEEQASSASCHAYQQAPDGTWTALPCQAHGAATKVERKSLAAGSDQSQR